ncbi:MAG: alpha-1,4-glucan--maltose-1-phosphate maltosyltransferase, partial [Nostocoides sp.]
LAGYLTAINAIRRAHPALSWLRNITFHHADDENVMCFSKRRVLPDGTQDTIIVVANLDPHSTRATTVHLDMRALGLEYYEGFVAHDLLTGQSWHWVAQNFVRLGADNEPVHIIHVRRY